MALSLGLAYGRQRVRAAVADGAQQVDRDQPDLPDQVQRREIRGLTEDRVGELGGPYCALADGLVALALEVGQQLAEGGGELVERGHELLRRGVLERDRASG